MIYESSASSHCAAGPKIAAIGGGTGLSTMLRGLKKYTDRLTAIVTVADDGGGSGVCTVRLGGAVKDYDVTDPACGLYEDLRQLILAVRKDYGYLVK